VPRPMCAAGLVDSTPLTCADTCLLLSTPLDLLELSDHSRRHPWEVARARAIGRIAEKHAGSPVRTILDWGCGDGYTGRFLLDRLHAESMVGLDVNLTEHQCGLLTRADRRVRLLREDHELTDRRFDLVLFCDVIEHVQDDTELVNYVVSRFLSPNGRVIVTVPAFQALFSVHDVQLKHFRRYDVSQLERVLRAAELEVLGSGYLFGSLLPARAATRLLQRFRTEPSSERVIGIGDWQGGEAFTRLTEVALGIDNSILLALAALGVKAPGLSVWASCKRLA
jgi:2-polyprenyl-3-methyl-5-hydroxy-6-metoxy-1,4-benzoquinol methylase